MNRIISTPIAIGIILILAIVVGLMDYWQYSEIKEIEKGLREANITRIEK